MPCNISGDLGLCRIEPNPRHQELIRRFMQESNWKSDFLQPILDKIERTEDNYSFRSLDMESSLNGSRGECIHPNSISRYWECKIKHRFIIELDPTELKIDGNIHTWFYDKNGKPIGSASMMGWSGENWGKEGPYVDGGSFITIADAPGTRVIRNYIKGEISFIYEGAECFPDKLHYHSISLVVIEDDSNVEYEYHDPPVEDLNKYQSTLLNINTDTT